MDTKSVVNVEEHLNADERKILTSMPVGKWCSTLQIEDEVYLGLANTLGCLHALSSIWIVDVKEAVTENGGYGYFWRRRQG